jgi:magnesium chelatase accessory protein
MSLTMIAARIQALLRVLGTKPAMIIGHSAGAALAIRMVLDSLIEPPRHIVSLNGALLPFPGMAGWLFPALAKVLVAGPFATELFAWRAAHPGAVARIIRGTGSPVDAASLGFYERLMTHRGHVRAALDMMAQWDLRQLARDMPRLTVPLTLVAGSADLAVPPDVAFQTRDIVAGAEVRLERGLGHLAHEESPERIAAIIGSVLPADASHEERQG